MYLKIDIKSGGSMWGFAIAMDIEGKFPSLVSTECGIMQRDAVGLYFLRENTNKLAS